MFKLLNKHYLKRYHDKYQHAKKLFVFDLALLLFALAMLGSSIFFFFWKPGLTNMVDLSLSLGDVRIKSGEEVRLAVNFTNRSKHTLQSVSLGLRLPDGFVINQDKTPKNIFSDNSIFSSITEIAPGANGQAEIYGTFWSEPNKDTKFTANLSFQPENKSGREQKLASFTAVLPESVLAGELTMATSTLANFPLNFIYTLKNSGAKTIDNISVTSNWLNAITDETAATDFSLAPNESKIFIGAITTPAKSGNYYFMLTPTVLINNTAIAQNASARELQIFAPEIISRASLLSNLNYAEPGQNFPINLSWKNKSKFKLQNLSLRLTANLPNVVDWQKTAKANQARAETDGISFNSQSRTGLADGNPNGADNFDLVIYLLPNFNFSETENANLEIYPVVNGQIAQISAPEFSQDGSGLRVPLATEVSFNEISARYYTSEGDQLGRGPLPPQVGKTTKYWIAINIANTSNALNDAVFTGSLPAGVEFTGKQSVTIGPQITFNPSSRAVSWRHHSLPAYSQTGLYFEVAITPQSSQIGQNILLTNSLNFSAVDNFTGKKFNLYRASINNLLPPDDRGRVFGTNVETP